MQSETWRYSSGTDRILRGDPRGYNKPDGPPKRCLDMSWAKREFGFEAEMQFHEGLERTIGWNDEHRTDSELRYGIGDHC